MRDVAQSHLRGDGRRCGHAVPFALLFTEIPEFRAEKRVTSMFMIELDS